MLDIYTWSVFLTGVFFTSFGIFAIVRNPKESSTRSFALYSLAFSVWSFSWFALLLTRNDYTQALFLARLLNFGAIFIPVLYLNWVLILLNKTKKYKYLICLAYIITFIFAFLSFSGYFISGVHSVSYFIFWPTAGPLYILFLIFGYIGLVFWGTIELIRHFILYKDEKRYQIGYVLLGALLGFGGSATIFPLMYQIKIIQPLGIFTIMVSPFVFGYAATRYQLMNIKIIAAQFAIGVLNIVLFTRIILANSAFELFFDVLIFIIVFIFSIYLIKSISLEIKHREKIEKLARDLAVANEKLKELDRQKTEFVSIASHQLRSPLTAIKGYSSMLLEGSFGPVEDKAKEAVDRIFRSSQKLVTVIEDFLNVTRIELGRMKYEISTFDLGALAQTVVKDQELNAKDKGLAIELQIGAGDHQISADNGKITQVISNIIDNSIKYTPSGWIKVKIENLPIGKSKVKEMVRLTVSDSGVGIDPATMPELFSKFVRANDAGKTNLAGTGLGLYVAKQIVEGLSGKIWAESEGKGKGSQFIVEFPRSNKPALNTSEKKIGASA